MQILYLKHGRDLIKLQASISITGDVILESGRIVTGSSKHQQDADKYGYIVVEED